jgi:hypothetical protein
MAVRNSDIDCAATTIRAEKLARPDKFSRFVNKRINSRIQRFYRDSFDHEFIHTGIPGLKNPADLRMP